MDCVEVFWLDSFSGGRFSWPLVERLASVKKRYPLTMPADWVHKSALALSHCSSLKKSKAHAGGRSAQRLGAVFS